MKILMLAPWFSPHSTRPLNWLLDAGHHVTFMDSRDPYPEGRDKYNFIPFPYADSGDLTIQRLGQIYHQLKPDVVHVHWVDIRAYFCVLAQLRPLILSVWGSDINQYLLRPDADKQAGKVIGQVLAAADLVLIDAPIMDERCDTLAERKVSTELLHLGIDTKTFRKGYQEAALAWRNKFSINADVKILLSSRSWVPNSNHNLILEAFAIAYSKLQTKMVLVFKIFNRISYQHHIAYEMELRRRAIELGIAGAVRWMDEVSQEQLPEIYAFADVIINYPSMDTFPITLLEAAACERSVITCGLPSYRDTFAEECFHMARPDSIEDLANAIIEYTREDPARRAILLAKARKEVEQKYDESIYIKRIQEIYSSL
jgi:glycosyltransferase involved in cell wall biosynthesis